MSWTDAARAASAAVRRAHAKGRKIALQRTRLYHGGPIGIRGAHLKAPRGGTVFATTNIRQAMRYRENYRAPERGGAVYVVNRPKKSMPFNEFHAKLKSVKGIERRLFLKKTAERSYGPGRRDKTRMVYATSTPMKILYRLPRARGRAARGKY